jgi:hypothetical protein
MATTRTQRSRSSVGVCVAGEGDLADTLAGEAYLEDLELYELYTRYHALAIRRVGLL